MPWRGVKLTGAVPGAPGRTPLPASFLQPQMPINLHRPIGRRQWLLGACAAASAPHIALAQTAGKPIRIVVPFTPGGSSDILARAIGPRLATALGVNVIVENRPGAGGSVAGGEVARAEADGSTLFMGHLGTLAVNPAIYPRLAYDPLRSFTPVAYVARVPNVLVVPTASEFKTFKDFLAGVRARPGRVTYSSGGNGSAAHITMEYLKLTAKLFLLHIPYRGTAPSINDLIASQVDTTFTGATAVLSHVRSGRLRALAVGSAQRIPALPDVPTVAESGFPGFEADQWYGLMAPAATPAAVVARINAEVNRAMALPEVAEQFQREGAVAVPTTPQAFGDLIRREIPRWAEVVKAGNVKPD